ncbi:hypothetical protein NX059_010985 [Plenodomus lindquistii]|nr:hypothetical protein NX059_010985 [Plenodomus lindquistii]
MTSALHGPGILYVTSRIKPSSSHTLDEATYLKWYDDDHIPELVSTSGIKSSFRFANTNPQPQSHDENSAAMPYLVYDPMQDLAFTTSDEFRNIRVESQILPPGSVIYDFAEFNVYYFGLHSVCGTKRGEDSVKFIVTERFSAEGELQRTAIETCNEMFGTVARASGYIRTLSFQLQFAHSNAQSNGSGKAEPGSWLCIHEFSMKPVEAVLVSRGEILEDHVGTTTKEMDVWELKKTFGEGRFFD